jgi:uncharacterized protein YbjT (DUF2867 family)
MSNRPIIAVAGATGAQGGGLVRAILSDPEQRFTARALTRDPSSPRARALAASGAEVVAADVDDVGSLERAFAGAYGAYCVTFFWEHMSPAAEQRQARNLALAAQRAGIKHAIWSTLEDARRWYPLSDTRMPTLMHLYKVPHTDAKGAMDYVFRDLGVPTTFLLTSFYWENLINFGMGPQRTPEGLVFALPMSDRKLPGIAAEDIGRCALGIFRGGATSYVGRRVGIAGQHLTGEEMAAAMKVALGEPVRYRDVPLATYRHLPIPAAEELANMFQFKQECNDEFRAVRDVTLSRELNPALQSFEQWLAHHGHRLAVTVPFAAAS